MPNRSDPSTHPRRLRPAALRPHGAASSLLRLTPTGGARLPSGQALSEWAAKASALLASEPAPEMVRVAESANEDFITPLHPSPSLKVASLFR